MIWFSDLLWSNVGENWRRFEETGTNRSWIRLNNSPFSHENRNGIGGREQVLLWLPKPLSLTHLAVCRHLHTQRHCLRKQRIHNLDETHIPTDRQSTSMYCGPNIYHWNKDFMVTIQYTNNDQIKTFLCSPGSFLYPFIEATLKNPPPNQIKNQNRKFWMNLIETSLRHSTENKEFLRFNLSCKWTPISPQEEHLKSTIFRIPVESTLHVGIRVIENLHAVILIAKTI